jgi:hypothetical protein
VIAFAIQKSQGFFTIGDYMHPVCASLVEKSRERQVRIRRIVLHEQNFNRSLGHGFRHARPSHCRDTFQVENVSGLWRTPILKIIER